MTRFASLNRSSRFGKLWTLVLLVGVWIGGCISIPAPPTREPPPRPSPALEDRPRDVVPVGTLLLEGEQGSFVIDSGIEGPIKLPADVAGLELSPDGGQILAARFVLEPTGITRHVELLTIDVQSAETAIIVAASPRGDVAPAAWSPDGTRVAYRLTTYARNPSVVHPHGHGSRSALCIVTIGIGEPRCLHELGRVDGFAWSPDGERIAIDVVGPEPLLLLDVQTGRTQAVGRPHGPWLGRVGSHGRFMGFSHPAWSPTGRYVAAVADTGFRRIVIFDILGHLVTGRRFTDMFTEPVWAPSRDVIAYASVTGRIRENHLGLDTSLRLLHARTGWERVVRTFRGYPLVYGLEWDPAGGSMAVLLYTAGREKISLMDLEGRWSPLRVGHSLSGLLDWSP